MLRRLKDWLIIKLRMLLPSPLRRWWGNYKQWRFKRRTAEVERDLEAIRRMKDDV